MIDAMTKRLIRRRAQVILDVVDLDEPPLWVFLSERTDFQDAAA
jgi:hypothetical protein